MCSEYGQEEGRCEHGNEPSGLIKMRNFLTATLTFSRNTVGHWGTLLCNSIVFFVVVSSRIISCNLYLFHVGSVWILEMYQQHSNACAESHIRIYHQFQHFHIHAACWRTFRPWRKRTV